ncbi:MAG TPA: hypothetical protein VFV50_03290 [Bdellovibrionales bacterium]|nr:hypothetical protein [Bdellovibrionales bacterium]
MNRARLWSVPAMSILSIGLLAACGEEKPSFALLPDGQTFRQDRTGINNKLDILFVINDQPNMSAFQEKLVTSMSTFMNIFVTKGFDYKIAVTTTSGYMADPTLNGYSAVNEDLADFNDTNGIQSTGIHVITPSVPDIFSVFAINAKPSKNSAGQDARSFSSMRQALRNTRPINAGFLRSDGFLAVIIVDNQEDFSGNARCNGCNINQRYNAPTLDPVDVYIDFLNTATNSSGAAARYNVSAMTQIAVPCQGGANMVRIMDLATRTNGVLGDICQADFGSSMADMADRIASLSTQFYLDRVPDVSTITVDVNGVRIPQDAANGWTYNADANSIQFHGSAIPPQDASINVNFDPVTIK